MPTLKVTSKEERLLSAMRAKPRLRKAVYAVYDMYSELSINYLRTMRKLVESESNEKAAVEYAAASRQDSQMAHAIVNAYALHTDEAFREVVTTRAKRLLVERR